MFALLRVQGKNLHFCSLQKTEHDAMEALVDLGDEDWQYVIYDVKGNEYAYCHLDDGWFFVA